MKFQDNYDMVTTFENFIFQEIQNGQESIIQMFKFIYILFSFTSTKNGFKM